LAFFAIDGAIDNGKSKLLIQNRERFSLLGLKLVVE
jgi:hypothetical protein